MADQKFIINVDNDWKKQAQEEKRRLAEAEAKAKADAAPPPPANPADVEAEITQEQLEAADTPFATLIQTLLTQTLVYLGGMGSRGGQQMMNLDTAKRSVDMLGSLDEKTKGNLTEEEKKLLDQAIYEVRMHYVQLAQRLG
jgi:hypothetical protein